MILIDNQPFDIAGLSGEYPENGIERQILAKMAASEEKFRYETISQLKFELLLRHEIVNAARDLNSSAFSFATFHDSKCNETYWERTGNGGFRMKNGVTASEAIGDIYQNSGRYATECATAMVILHYKALLAVFGPERFDRMFPEIYLMNWHSLDRLLKEIGRPRRTDTVLIGDRGYFSNPDVDPKTPEWQGENVIVLPDGLYYGHGIGIATAENIINALNGNRREGATREAYWNDSVSRPNFHLLTDLYESAQPAMLGFMPSLFFA